MKNMFKVKDLRNKIAFTLFMLLLFRLGSHVPAPGIDVSTLQTLRDNAGQSGALEFLRLFSGGAITQFAVFALGVMPYITSSIIMQILAVVIPKLEQWQQQGAVGQRKITQWTRYLTVAIAVMQSTGLTFLFKEGGQGFAGGNPLGDVDLFGGNYNWSRVLIVVVSLTAGTALIMWMGELITQRGIGNGMSLLIFASVVSQLPANFGAVYAESGTIAMVLVALMFIALMVGIVFIEQGQRRIPVQFAKRQVGRRQYGGQNTYIPLKVNSAGIIPIIFANSMLYLPVMIGTVLPAKANADGGGGNWAFTARQFIDDHFSGGTSPIYLTVYFFLIIGFAYFYAAIQFDPHKQADQIRKQGGFIPGIRPGIQTERYLGRILNRITLPGALFIAFVALAPAIVLGQTLEGTGSLQLGFFGTSILIAVGVALETMKQIDSQLMMRNYEGFLKT
jgi:preprotein translocase subunit SecY